MLIITKNARQVAQVEPLNWQELKPLWPLGGDSLAEIPTADLDCFADLSCVQTTFNKATCFMMRGFSGCAKPVGFVAITGLNKEECEPNIESFLLDRRAETAAFYAQLGICGMLLRHPDVQSVESVLSTDSPQALQLHRIGFTKTLTMNTNVPRGPQAAESCESQWILQDPGVLRGTSQHDEGYRAGWIRYQQNLKAVEFVQNTGSEPFFTIQ